MTEFLVCAGVPLVILNILWFSGSFRARKQLQYVSAQFQASAMEEWPRMTPDQIAWAVDEVFAQVGMGASEQQARWGSLGEQKLKWLAAGMYIRYCAMAPAGREREAAIRARTPGLLIAQVQGEEIFTWRQLLDERVYQANLHNSWQVCEQLEAAKFCLENPTDDPQFVVAAKTIATSTVATTTASRSIHQSLAWAEVLEQNPDPKVVTDADFLTRIKATGLPWRVRDKTGGIELLLVPPGKFMMGMSPGDREADANETPPHEVTITKPFYLGRYEVTLGERASVMGKDPSHREDVEQVGSDPVSSSSWNSCSDYCRKTGLRLPTEAEWEYACRAGVPKPRYGKLEDIAVFIGSRPIGIQPVGKKVANALGFHDMLGNAREWCQDWAETYPDAPVTDPEGRATGTHRVIRGGASHMDANDCRASSRLFGTPDDDGPHSGFRVARDPQRSQLNPHNTALQEVNPMGLFEKLFGNNRKADTQTHTNAMIAPMIAIILVDGKVSAARRSVVERRLFQLGGDPATLPALLRSPPAIVAISNPDDRQRAYIPAALVMWVDGVVSVSEMMCMTEIGMQLGMTPHEMIEAMESAKLIMKQVNSSINVDAIMADCNKRMQRELG